MTSTIKNKKVVNIVLNDFTNDSRVLKISRSLANNGFEVLVVALHDADLPVVESANGFEVHRVKLWSRGLAKRKIFQLFKYLEFSLRVLFRYGGQDACHCNDLHALPVGALLKLFSFGKLRLVYDAHEYETEANGVGKLEKKLRKLLEGFLIRFASRTITVSDSIADEYARLYGISKPEIVLNIPLLATAPQEDLFREHLGIERHKQIFLYQGALSPGRGIEILLDAFDQDDASGKVIVFMGYGPLQPEILRRAADSDCIYFHPAVPHDEIPRYTSSADIGISTIENTCLSYYYCLPNKLFEYLMAEIPVMVSNLFEMKKMVEKHDLGVVVDENSSAGIRLAMSKMDDFDRAGFVTRVQKFNRLYNWQNQEKTLVSLYREILVDADG